MKFNKIINIAAFCVMLLASCQEHDITDCTEGYLDLTVTCDETLQIVPVSKSDDNQQTINLTVYDSKDNVVAQWADIAQITEPVQLLTGKYKAVATYGEETYPVAFDSPFYSGETEFSIRPNVITSANVVCTLTSLKVTVDMSDEIIDNFDYSLTVSNGAGELVYDEETLDCEGYFALTDHIEWTLVLVNAKNEIFTFSDRYDGVTAAQHYALSFSIEHEVEVPQGAADFKIRVDDSLNEPKYHDVVVIIDKNAPSVTGPDIISRYMADMTDNAVITLNSSLPYTGIMLTHDDPALTTLGVPTENDIMTMTDFSVLAEAGIDVVATESIVTFDFTSLVNMLGIGSYSFTLTSTNTTEKEVVKEIRIEVLSSMGAVTLDPWAMFVYFKGSWLSERMPEDITLQYRMLGESQWNEVESTFLRFNTDRKEISGFVCGLDTHTSYDLRLASKSEAGEILSTMTEDDPQLYNFSFDEWCSENGGAPYASNADPKIWDTANPGTKSMNVYPTTQETDDVIFGSAVRMESTYASMLGIGKFAAGNIYTGQFLEADLSSMGAMLKWGVAFTGRPLGLKGHYKYTPKQINYTTSGYKDLEGQMDICQIQAALADWTAPFDVNTGTNTFVEFSKSNKTILAHNEWVTGSTEGQWLPFDFYLTYRNVKTRPSYVIVSACASRYGDYFTGATGSVMLIDEFSFIYDPMELSEEDRTTFFSLFK